MRAELLSRRDERYEIPEGRGNVEFADPSSPGTRCHTTLTRLSICGINFRPQDCEIEIPVNTQLAGVTIQVGACSLRGKVLVKSRRPTDSGAPEYGGLFYPSSERCEQLLMALVSGIAAIQPDGVTV